VFQFTKFRYWRVLSFALVVLSSDARNKMEIFFSQLPGHDGSLTVLASWAQLDRSFVGTTAQQLRYTVSWQGWLRWARPATSQRSKRRCKWVGLQHGCREFSSSLLLLCKWYSICSFLLLLLLIFLFMFEESALPGQLVTVRVPPFIHA
jgi:hypothetical protein